MTKYFTSSDATHSRELHELQALLNTCCKRAIRSAMGLIEATKKAGTGPAR